MASSSTPVQLLIIFLFLTLKLVAAGIISESGYDIQVQNILEDEVDHTKVISRRDIGKSGLRFFKGLIEEAVNIEDTITNEVKIANCVAKLELLGKAIEAQTKGRSMPNGANVLKLDLEGCAQVGFEHIASDSTDEVKSCLKKSEIVLKALQSKKASIAKVVKALALAGAFNGELKECFSTFHAKLID